MAKKKRLSKFLYLCDSQMADTWTKGGEVPISMASKYFSHERKGIMTPDENLIHRSPVDVRRFEPMIRGNFRNLTITGVNINGEHMPDVVGADYYRDNRLLLSFCNLKSKDICRKFDYPFQKKVCIRIKNVDKLRKIIDHQLGTKGEPGNCNYTADHQRNHFLKGKEDEWQKEYRILWQGSANVTVKLPSGIASFEFEI